MSTISLTIPGPPVGKQRARICRTGHYTPAKTVNYETLIKELFAIAYPNHVPFSGPISLQVRAFIAPSKADAGKLKRTPRLRPTKKPDLDNIIKLVCDALNGLAYADDKQIVAVLSGKNYSDQPRTEIIVEETELIAPDRRENKNWRF